MPKNILGFGAWKLGFTKKAEHQVQPFLLWCPATAGQALPSRLVLRGYACGTTRGYHRSREDALDQIALNRDKLGDTRILILEIVSGFD